MAQSLFDHVSAIRKKNVDPKTYWENLDEESKKSFNTYMVHRFLSMHPDLNDLVASIEHLSTMIEDKHSFRLLYDIIPEHGYTEYIKSDETYNASGWPDWMIEFLADYYECSTREAREYAVTIMQTKENRKRGYKLFRGHGFSEKDMKEVKKNVTL